MEPHSTVSREEWLVARRALLAEEKAFTRARDELNRKRLALPWVKVDKTYTFDTPGGRKTLAELFDGRSQLIVYHFMMGPDWQEGCPGCSFISDGVDGMLTHLEHHDVSYVTVSRAPLAKIEAFKKRMGWGFDWVSSFGSEFNYDYHVSFTPEQMASGRGFHNFADEPLYCEEMHGHSVFYKDDAGTIFHTYSVYARGDESFLIAYAALDIAPKGRNEVNNMNDWMKHHDRYEDAPSGCPACAAKAAAS
ncbi:thioredoxin family protein [Paraburkholderia sp.]|jgi:predicted dithiol-disulfide oxidoreductase (DUF899 family)|uniref:DUF899 domain-containing protein n=1 Tax=Paraburkholderia sp. TaxID=1926495 RepID=UPI002F3FD5E8